MDIITLIPTVFKFTDDWLGHQPRYRCSESNPIHADSEVLNIEIMSEFLSIDQEHQMFKYFRTHFFAEFQALKRIHCMTFTRQAANLWKVKE